MICTGIVVGALSVVFVFGGTAGFVGPNPSALAYTCVFAIAGCAAVIGFLLISLNVLVMLPPGTGRTGASTTIGTENGEDSTPAAVTVSVVVPGCMSAGTKARMSVPSGDPCHTGAVSPLIFTTGRFCGSV